MEHNKYTDIDERIDSVLSQFDFEKVEKAMKALGWDWAMSGERKVPSQYHLAKRAEKLLREVLVEGGPVAVKTGGLKASRYQDVLQLEFVLEQAVEEYDEENE